MNNNEIPNQELWNTFQTIKTDNFNLRRSLIKKDREVKSLEKQIKSLKIENKKLKKEV